MPIWKVFIPRSTFNEFGDQPRSPELPRLCSPHETSHISLDFSPAISKSLTVQEHDDLGEGFHEFLNSSYWTLRNDDPGRCDDGNVKGSDGVNLTFESYTGMIRRNLAIIELLPLPPHALNL
ncbi:hypothetical protein Moror_3361 [Moniliophthora roreri MCA 2997]|uniref:Uncharacterized protein n=1 Tax=Moniliophthora roreri (strain MCA 2997) TaxID=1381753 RepID=V2Y5N0_MONRO|nr:hypothetical protein Moror_3361 [Moniliophthora roreri MCA 2997]